MPNGHSYVKVFVLITTERLYEYSMLQQTMIEVDVLIRRVGSWGFKKRQPFGNQYLRKGSELNSLKLLGNQKWKQISPSTC